MKKISSRWIGNPLPQAEFLVSKELCRVKLIAEVLVDRDANEGDALDRVYERFEASDTTTAEKRSAGILFRLGFDNAMKAKTTRDST